VFAIFKSLLSSRPLESARGQHATPFGRDRDRRPFSLGRDAVLDRSIAPVCRGSSANFGGFYAARMPVQKLKAKFAL
jgi:hypothetical protein